MSAADEFDETAYLAANKDVRTAVLAGHFSSGFDHYEIFGRQERRPLKEDVVKDVLGLDAKIDWLRDLQASSFSDWLHARAKFRFDEDIDSLPKDPFSTAYTDQQMQLYQRISGAGVYDPWTAEPIKIGPESRVDPFPFPFTSHNGELIAGHLLSLSHIIRTLWKAAPVSGQRILEYGCGTGFTTLLLAASGYKMTAVDINADALAVLDQMARSRGLDVVVYNGVFGDKPSVDTRYDAVLFYEAFHHALDFMSLFQSLHNCIEPGGTIVFAGEPIFDDFPKPWGLRLDGASLWEIRTKGWLELGFRTSFFISALEKTGWDCEKLTFIDAPDMFVAREKPSFTKL